MIWLVSAFLVLQCVYSTNILYIAPLASPSHYLWNKVLALELVSNGHNVTILTHDEEKTDLVENYTVITIEGLYENMNKYLNVEDIMLNGNVLDNIFGSYSFVDISCNHDFKSEAFQKLLNYPPDFKFDLIIFDIVGPTCLYGFIHKFNNPPVVSVTAFGLSPQFASIFANPLYTSYTPYYSSTFTNAMSFYERTLNFIYTYLDILLYKYSSFPHQDEIAKIAFNASLPSFTEVLKNVTLYLINTNPVIDYPIPLVPNIIPVGGLQIKPPKCLSQDLENIFENAKHGVIFFSLGTNVNSNVFTNDQINTFLNVFSKLQQVIVWKFDPNRVTSIPENVIIRKWLPQSDILGHPKTKLFITHCGALSTQETIYHAVPVVGIPYFLDQNANMAKILAKQIGVYLDNKNFTVDSIYEAITEVLHNQKYSSKIKILSEIFKNQINSPLDRAVFWVDHVLKYGAPEYLNTPGKNMPLYQVADLDVIFFLLLSTMTFFFSIYYIMRKLMSCIFVNTNIM